MIYLTNKIYHISKSMKKIVYSGLLLSILQSILFWHKDLGISVVIFLTAVIVAIIYNFKEKGAIKNKKAILWAIPIELLGITYFIFNNGFFQIINIPIILILLIIMCDNITNGEIRENRFIRNIINTIFKPFGMLSKFISDFDAEEFLDKKKENTNSVETKKIVKSLLVAIPVILIILVLLSSADSVFGSIFGNVTDFIFDLLEVENINDILARAIFVIIYFVYIVGFLVMFVKKDKKVDEQKEERKTIKLSSLTINILFVSLNIIYLIFSIIQFKYLFINAGKTADFDYATYARTGFFQLMFVSFINFALLHISNKNVKQEDNQTVKITINKTNISKVLLVFFTIVIIISAMFRMYLYEQEYGYTYLRIFVYFILITEIFVLIPIIIKVLGKKINTFKIAIEIITLMYVLLNYINIDSMIAKKNIDKYLENPEEHSIDIYYITSATGTDAIEEKLRLLNYEGNNLSASAWEELDYAKEVIKSHLRTYKTLYGSEDSFVEWNLSEYKSRKLLKNVDVSTSENY